MAGVAAVGLVRAGAARLPCDCGAVLIVRGCAISTEDRRRLQTQNFTRVLHLEHLSLPTCSGCCVLAVNDEMVATIGVLAPVQVVEISARGSLQTGRAEEWLPVLPTTKGTATRTPVHILAAREGEGLETLVARITADHQVSREDEPRALRNLVHTCCQMQTDHRRTMMAN